MARDPYQFFRIEARELVEQMAMGVLDLEKGLPTREAVAGLLRLAHTLKGAARVVKQDGIADSAHTIEGTLLPFREGAEVPREGIQGLLKLLDRIQVLVAALPPATPTGSGATAVAPQAAVADEPFRLLRSTVEEMDTLVEGVTEARVQLVALARNAKTVERARELAGLLENEVASPRTQRALNGATSKLQTLVGELTNQLSLLERNLPNGVEQVDRELQQVRDNTERLRLLPASAVFNTLERTARDAAHSLSRRVTFSSKGGDVRLDGYLLGVVQNALVQAVRNAVAHGIEDPAERRALGKTPEGRIVVEVNRRGKRVAFVCQDDGRGIDLAAVRRAVERKGGVSASAERLGDDDLLRILLNGGISTAGRVTEVSGRGVGLDVVREAAGRVGGEIDIRTVPGRGTTLEIVVPMTLSSLEALVVEAGGQAVAIPLTSVPKMLRIAPADMAHSSNGVSISFEGKTIPFVPLARLIGAQSPMTSHEKAWSTVVVESGGTTIALGVDRLLGTENIVLRPLSALTPADPIVAGASLDSEGNPRMVLDPDELVRAAASVKIVQSAVPARPSILVIDDSLTTRMLEQSILESAGYRVDVAASGEEGMEKAQANRYTLILCDVEMPGMDGFTFVDRLRADAALRETPVFLVTSRDTPQDRRHGAAVGATAYIVKNEFNQAELLERIRRLVG